MRTLVNIRIVFYETLRLPLISGCERMYHVLLSSINLYDHRRRELVDLRTQDRRRDRRRESDRLRSIRSWTARGGGETCLTERSATSRFPRARSTCRPSSTPPRSAGPFASAATGN